MNDIGIGILCFGDDYYYEATKKKVRELTLKGLPYYILTDNPNPYHYEDLLYDRELRSYHDKMLLPKHILKYHDICVLIDADAEINDYSFLEDIKYHKFNPGISYLDVLLNHPEKKEFVKDISMSRPEWKPYKKYISEVLPDYGELDLMWEYFIVINAIGSNLKEFYNQYERLQVAKESGELTSKEVVGCGEGISIAAAAKLSGTPCERDYTLYKRTSHKISNQSRKYIRDDFK